MPRILLSRLPCHPMQTLQNLRYLHTISHQAAAMAIFPLLAFPRLSVHNPPCHATLSLRHVLYLLRSFRYLLRHLRTEIGYAATRSRGRLCLSALVHRRRSEIAGRLKLRNQTQSRRFVGTNSTENLGDCVCHDFAAYIPTLLRHIWYSRRVSPRRRSVLLQRIAYARAALCPVHKSPTRVLGLRHVLVQTQHVAYAAPMPCPVLDSRSVLYQLRIIRMADRNVRTVAGPSCDNPVS